MATFFTSDTHFSHARIIDLCGRPFASIDEMNEAIISNFNEQAEPDDTIYHLGDACMGKLDESLLLIKRINARVVLYVGNHDRPSLAYGGVKKAHKIPAARERYLQYFDDVILDAKVHTLQVGERGFQVSHYPFEGDHGDEDRFPQLRPKNIGLPLLHGHVHELWKFNGRQFNVGVDVNDFKLVTEDEVLEWVETL